MDNPTGVAGATGARFAAELDAAARLIHSAGALLVCAGAGMGVDSGLPDFRGDEGFWRAYPPYARLGLSFVDLADPAHFDSDPELAWGFYGHRLALYRDTVPHPGFAYLLRWGSTMPGGVRVFTSNVDGQFSRAGFPRVAEVHGSIHRLQCVRPCSRVTWPADDLTVTVDHSTMRAARPLPRCPRCGSLARPNILMFGDGAWLDGPSATQEKELASWLHTTALAGPGRLAVVELGAGTAIPTVRMVAEHAAARADAVAAGGTGSLIRVNPDPAAASVPPGAGVSLPMGALAALSAINERLG